VAQPGSALALGARSPEFKSRRPDLFYVYIIRSQRTQRYYVGSTEVVEQRLQEHNKGKSASTRAGTPWELIRTENFSTRSEAILQERKIKARGIGRYLSDLERVSSR
jgi:putative endonuclease